MSGHSQGGALLDQVVAWFANPRQNGTGTMVNCPVHEDRKQSLHISLGSDGRIVLHCHAGCETKHILERVGKTYRDLYPPTDRAFDPEHFDIKAYDYIIGGELRYQSVRRQYADRKEFYQRRPRPGGGWFNDMKGVDRFPYRIDAIQTAPPETPILFLEGEKDVDRATAEGWIATTNAGGAGKWLMSFGAWFRAMPCVLIPDNDEPGFQHMLKVAQSLEKYASSIAIVRLTSVPPKGDLSDFLDAGGSIQDLASLASGDRSKVSGAELISIDELKRLAGMDEHDEPPADASPPNFGDGKPTIFAQDQDIPSLSAQAWPALQRGNDPVRLVLFGEVPTRIDKAEDGSPLPQPLTEDRLIYELGRSATFWGFRKDPGTGETRKAIAKVPRDLARDMLASPAFPFPGLLSIVRTPIFAADGRLHIIPGYNATTKAYYHPQADIHIPDVPERPTSDDVSRSIDLIDELLRDFPFTSDADRANAIGLFLETAARNLIDGPTPFRLISSPTPGTGKGLLADCLLRSAVGRQIGVMPAATDDDEWRKRITAQLVQLPAVVHIDNITKVIDSGEFAAALTGIMWTDRRLGSTTMLRMPIRCIWIGTANNPTMSTEIARRTVQIRLDPGVDRPWQRTGFQHENLRNWVDDHRGELIWASLVLIQHWLTEGAPRSAKFLGSFESWASVMGGIVASAGVDGFLGNLESFYE